MEKRTLDFGQLYGYAVCLLAVVTFLVASAEVIRATLDLRELPYSATYREGPSLVSLGAYRMDLLSRAGTADSSAVAAAVLPPDSTLQSMFESERLYRLALSHQANRKTVVIGVVLQALAALLFAAHWIWLRRRERHAPGGSR